MAAVEAGNLLNINHKLIRFTNLAPSTTDTDGDGLSDEGNIFIIQIQNSDTDEDDDRLWSDDL